MEKMRIVNAQFNTSKKRKSTKPKSSKRSMKLVTMRKETKKTTSSSKNNKKKKKKQSILEAEIMRIMQKSLKTAIDMALDDILKDFK